MDSLYLALNNQNIVTLKIQAYFLIYARMNGIIMFQKKGISVDINKTFMTKTLSKSIMESTFLEKYFRKIQQIID